MDGSESAAITPRVMTDIAQSMDVGGDFLEHFGVKGMKWGARKAAKQAAVEAHRSADSLNAKNHRETIDKHGVHALSNQELKALVTRMELVQKYANLSKPKKTDKNANALDKGHTAIKKALAVNKTIGEVQKTLNSPLFKGLKFVFKTAAKTHGPSYTTYAIRQIPK